jgi:hypothetical protein
VTPIFRHPSSSEGEDAKIGAPRLDAGDLPGPGLSGLDHAGRGHGWAAVPAGHRHGWIGDDPLSDKADVRIVRRRLEAAGVDPAGYARPQPARRARR